MSRAKLESLGTKDPIGTLSEDSTHIGLANVNQRIKLKYGEKYGVLIKSKPGVGTKVTILLPKTGTKERGEDEHSNN